MVTQAIFEASKCPAESIFLSIMQKRVLPFAPEAYEYFMKQDRAHRAHYASSQSTRVADQSTTNFVESNVQWLTAAVDTTTPTCYGFPCFFPFSWSPKGAR